MISVAERIAKELEVSPRQVEAAVALLDGGATVPFISRYRKEATGGLDDGHLRTLEERLAYLRELDTRRDAVIESIASQGKLTSELEAALREADTKTRIEDLYLPFKPKRRTKGEIAREAGLEPLADALLADPTLDPRTESLRFVDSSKNVPDGEAALDGARSILMERFAQDAELVGRVREYCWEHGRFTSRVNEGQEEAGAKYRDYFDHNEPLRDVPSHRALAMLRGFLEGHLYVCLAVDVAGADAPHPCETMIAAANSIASRGRPADSWLLEVAGAAWRVKLFPHVQTDLLGRVRERAEVEAIRVFAANLKDLLLAAPAGAKAAIGLDPGLRTGVKAAMVDATGKLVAHATLYPHPPRNDFEGSAAVLAKLVREHDVKLIAIGNGTAGRETDRFVAATLKAYPDLKFAKVIVSEAGASVYSASALAAEEFPDLDVTIRGAVSIARRLQDPLAELVKIDPKSIGVGQYQHDVNQSFLARALDATVEDCVNAVGVDLNTASAPLLSRVSGLGPSAAGNIVALRNLRGPFKNRSELMDVPRFGPKTFEQAAGFLRINGGADPLDGSAVHPESYELVERIAAANGRDVRSLIGDSTFLRRLRPADYVTERFGLPTVTDILKELEKPGRDPRPEFRTASLRDEVENLADLEPGMILEGTVTNVANFGAFVDIGVHQDGLAHISALSHKFVRDPREVVKAGDIVKVKVLSVDMERKRIALTLRLDDELDRADRGEIRPEPRRGGRQGTGTAAPRETGGGGSLAQAFAQASRKKSP